MPVEFFNTENRVDVADIQYYFHVKAANHEILCHSEGYSRAEDAKRGYQALIRAMRDDFIKNLLTTMFEGWKLHEANQGDAVACAGKAAEDEKIGYLLYLFSHWSNDIMGLAPHFGVALDIDADNHITGILTNILPAPSPEHYWDKGKWVGPPPMNSDKEELDEGDV